MDDVNGTLSKLYKSELVGGLEAVQPRHAVFSSLYSTMVTNAVQVEMPVGNGLVIKSDLPLIVRVGKNEPVRNVFDLIVNASVDNLTIFPQLSGTFPEGRVCVYSLFPAKYLRRWQREITDLPTTSVNNTAIDFTAGASQVIARNLSAIAQESVFLTSFSLFTLGTTAPISKISFADVQGVAQTLWAKVQGTATTNIFLEEGGMIKLPPIHNISINYTATALANAYELVTNYKFR